MNYNQAVVYVLNEACGVVYNLQGICEKFPNFS